jgi:hypothetical protein
VSLTRFITGLLFASALLFTAAGGRCAEREVSNGLSVSNDRNASNDLSRQIAERTKQYQESLRQRAAQLSPALQSKIESQAQKTVAQGLEKWTRGKIDLQMAIPGWMATYRTASFVARHLPFSGSPAGSLAFGSSRLSAALIVTTMPFSPQVGGMPVANSTIVRSSMGSLRQNGDALSYFVGIVCTIVQRR